MKALRLLWTAQEASTLNDRWLEMESNLSTLVSEKDDPYYLVNSGVICSVPRILYDVILVGSEFH